MLHAACQEFYAGLECLDSGCLTLEEHIVLGSPFATFTESKMRERERELQFMTGDICGSGWQKKPGLSMCHLHTSPVPIEVWLCSYHMSTRLRSALSFLQSLGL